jgi:hypothetical protein
MTLKARRVLAPGLAAAAAGVLWIATGGLPGLVRLWAVAIAVLLPVAAMKQISGIEDPSEIPRIPAYISSIVTLWILVGLTTLVLRSGGLGAEELRLVAMPLAPLAGWTTASIAASLLILSLAHWLRVRESAFLLRLLPQSAVEKQVFAGLSVTAGFCEEIVFRGFLLYVLAQAFGTVAAVTLSSAAFALAHAYQDARGAARAGLIGVILALPPVLSGSLWPSIIAHTAVDLIGGLLLKDRFTRDVA